MVDVLKRYREPLAWLSFALVAAYAVYGLVMFGITVSRGESLARAATQQGRAFHVMGYLVLVAVVITCVAVKPPTPRARMLSLLTFALGAVTVVADIVFAVLMLLPSSSETLFKVASIVGTVIVNGFKVALVIAAWALFRSTSAPQTGVALSPSSSGALAPTGSAQVTQPTWQASEASGGAWTRAGDAATGAGAAAWGTPGQSSTGWQPQSPPSQAAQAPNSQQSQNQYPQQNQYSQQNQYAGEAPQSYGSATPAPQSYGSATPAPQSYGSATPAPGSYPSASAPDVPWTNAGQAAQGWTPPAPVDESVDATDDEQGTILRPAPQWRPAQNEGRDSRQ